MRVPKDNRKREQDDCDWHARRADDLSKQDEDDRDGGEDCCDVVAGLDTAEVDSRAAPARSALPKTRRLPRAEVARSSHRERFFNGSTF